MDKITITDQTKTPTGWQFTITLGTSPNTTSHLVTLDNDYWQRITNEEIAPPELITKSFQFLLEREPKESILPQFDLPLINHYFPEYEQTISNS